MTSRPPWEQYIVHIPRPDAFGDDAASKAELLRHVRYILLVGSLFRPRRIAERLPSENNGMRHVGTYLNTVEHSHISDREFNVEILDLGVSPTAHVAVASHGIGMAGVEIVLVELFALINSIQHTSETTEDALPHQIFGVGRSGTRGTLGDEAYGTVGLSTVSYSETFEAALPNPELLQLCIQAGHALKHPVSLGAGMSAPYFWAGQGRRRPTQHRLPQALDDRDKARAQEMLWSWVERGVSFVEMEDFAVHQICRQMGMASVSAGAIIARRYDANTGRFVLDYDAEAKKRSELHPAEIILKAFQEHWTLKHA